MAANQLPDVPVDVLSNDESLQAFLIDLVEQQNIINTLLFEQLSETNTQLTELLEAIDNMPNKVSLAEKL